MSGLSIMFDILPPITETNYFGISFVGITLTVAKIERSTDDRSVLSITQGLKYSDLSDLSDLSDSKIIVNDEETRRAISTYAERGNYVIQSPTVTLAKLPRLIEALQSESLICVDEKSNRIASRAIVVWTEKQQISGDYQALMNAFYGLVSFYSSGKIWGW